MRLKSSGSAIASNSKAHLRSPTKEKKVQAYKPGPVSFPKGKDSHHLSGRAIADEV